MYSNLGAPINWTAVVSAPTHMHTPAHIHTRSHAHIASCIYAANSLILYQAETPNSINKSCLCTHLRVYFIAFIIHSIKKKKRRNDRRTNIKVSNRRKPFSSRLDANWIDDTYIHTIMPQRKVKKKTISLKKEKTRIEPSDTYLKIYYSFLFVCAHIK